MSELLPRQESDWEKPSSEVAKGKLEKLLDPAFDAFAIRFMNIGEYEQMMEQRKFYGVEMLVFRPRRDEPKLYDNFSDFLTWSKKDWYSVIRHFTDWSMSAFRHNPMMP